MRPAPILSAFRQALGEAWAGGAGALLPLGFFAGAAVLVPLGGAADDCCEFGRAPILGCLLSGCDVALCIWLL